MSRRYTGFVLAAALALLAFNLGFAGPVLADGNSSLNLSKSFELRGDFTAAGVGLRGVGSGVINLNGIPAGASVYRAYLYWATLGSANTYTSPTLNGVPVFGSLIGTSGDTCWGVQHNFVYRADVSSIVTDNGMYTIAGLPADLVIGNNSQGASLVVVYRLDSQPFRTILFEDGAVSLDTVRTSYTNTIGGFTPDQPLTSARIAYLVGDGQAQWDSGNLNFNGTPIGANVFSGKDGKYWGTHVFDVTNLVTGSPVTTTIHDTDPANPNTPDCLLWAASVFSVTSPVSNSTNQMTQAYQNTLQGDVTSAGVGLRGKGSGSIDLSGIPTPANVVQAYLYWATIGNSGSYVSPTLNGNAVSGKLIGVSADTCWGALHNYTYRADVTSLVTGDGTYSVAGLPSDLQTGNDSQGAGLVVVYSSPTLWRTIIINDGAVTLNFDVHSFTDTLGDFTANQPNAEAHVTYMVGDGQSKWTSGNLNFEGHTIGENVFDGVDGNYWGTLTFDVTGLVTEPNVTTTMSDDNPNDPTSPDCLLWVGTVLSVQTEPPHLDFHLYFPLVAKQ